MSTTNFTLLGNFVLLAAFPFSLDERSGVLRTRGEPIDRETQAEYRFRVLATDEPGGSHPRLTGNATVLVFVQDLNDQLPEWQFPNSESLKS